MCSLLVASNQGNIVMTGKISLSAAAVLVALSAPAFAAQARTASDHSVVSATTRAADHFTSFDAMSSEDSGSAHRYHGGPKSDD